MITRALKLPELLKKKSFFLFGPRGTGKTSLIRTQLSADALVVDLLRSDVYLRLAQRPSELEQMIGTGTQSIVVIDEVQKLPLLLDEVHRLIEAKGVRFLLTGSSVRKLRHGGANLLAGRAWTTKLLPFTSQELEAFNLERYLSVGGLPGVYLSEDPREELQAYVQTYLTEEIAAEGVVRDLPRFSRFLRSAALSSGEILNFQSIAEDAGVSPTTVREYYRILEDTLLGYLIEPHSKAGSRKEVSKAKFYLFDLGVRNALRGISEVPPQTKDFGDAFEHFIALELIAALEYLRVHRPLKFWRTHTQLEVDFIVEGLLAIEVKSTHRAKQQHGHALRTFSELYPTKHLCVVSQDEVQRSQYGVLYLHYREFLKRVWSGEFFE